MDKRQFERGIRIESREHPWLKKGAVKKLVGDHLKIHPNEYKK